MSNWEHSKGILKRIEPKGNETVEQLATRVLGYNEEEYDLQDFIDDCFYREILLYEGNLYDIEIIKEKVQEVFKANKSPVNNDIEFEVCFYCGDMHFDEALHTAIDNLEE